MYCFVPEENLPLLDSRTFDAEQVHLIAVQEPGMVKRASAAFEKRSGAVRIPRPAWRYQASTFIGCFVLEQLLEGERFDAVVQAISAAFAPIGIYRVLREHGRHAGGLPRFIGIQQAANCSMFRAWKAQSPRIAAPPVPSTRGLLTQVMYDAEPHTYGTFEELCALLAETGGFLTTLDHAEFRQSLDRSYDGRGLLELLAENGVDIAVRDGEVIDKTGLIALTGALRQIEAGSIALGSRILVCLTSGTARPDGRAVPESRIRAAELMDARPRRSESAGGLAHV
jgi:hypothetical protein